jgi:hypothetical protein
MIQRSSEGLALAWARFFCILMKYQCSKSLIPAMFLVQLKPRAISSSLGSRLRSSFVPVWGIMSLHSALHSFIKQPSNLPRRDSSLLRSREGAFPSLAFFRGFVPGLNHFEKNVQTQSPFAHKAVVHSIFAVQPDITHDMSPPATPGFEFIARPI